MLTFPEKIVFVIAVLATIYAAWRVGLRIVRTIHRGQGQVDWSVVPKRLVAVLAKVGSFQPVFRYRFWPSLFHGFVGWAFIYYLLVNFGDTLEGFFLDFKFLGDSLVGDVYRLLADLLSVLGIIGMLFLIIRRFILRPPSLTAREDIKLGARARVGIRRDSTIVGSFILVHVGSRFLGQSFHLAAGGGASEGGASEGDRLRLTQGGRLLGNQVFIHFI